MGDPKKSQKKYEKPRRVWDADRITNDKKVRETYGLKNMREIWVAQSEIRRKRKNARILQALAPEEREKRVRELIESLRRTGVLNDGATLTDVLNLRTEDLLERRLQTIVMRKGLANTAKQARQFVVHGKIAIGGKKASRPSRIVTREEEKAISWFKGPMEIIHQGKQAQDKGKVPERKGNALREAFEEAKGGEAKEAPKAAETPKTPAAKPEAKAPEAAPKEAEKEKPAEAAEKPEETKKVAVVKEESA